MLSTGLNGLNDYIEDAVERLGDAKGGSADELAGDLAHLLTKVAQVAGELRKAEAEERRRGEAFTPDAVLVWFSALPQREQAGLLSELERKVSSKGRSGLA